MNFSEPHYHNTNFHEKKFPEAQCQYAQSQFSAYHDAALTQPERRALQAHLTKCSMCSASLTEWNLLQSEVGSLGRVPTPRNLALRARVAVSNEMARYQRPRFALIQGQLEHLWHTYALPAVSGTVTAVAVFVLLLSFFAPPPVAASSADVPLLLSTPPELQASTFGADDDAGTIMENSLLVEVLLDEQGHVFDYHVISTTGDATRLLPQVKNMLLFTEFRPAMNMGRPITGRALMTFSARANQHRQA